LFVRKKGAFTRLKNFCIGSWGELYRRLKDPFCGVSHAVGALLALCGLIFLLVESKGDPWRVTSFAIYGATLFILYTASSLYHSLRVSSKAEDALLGFDRAAIYALIAGTYTPICLVALPTGWGWSLLGVVWGLAITGILIDVISRRRTPNWLQAVLYLLTGWVALIAIGPLVRALPIAALGWLGAGCLIYTVGAVICVTERPRIRPGVFGAHELWHVLVLAGSVCHFVVMAFIARS
jgi:hemolysin III